MAAVFLAQDLVLERQVAIKVLPPDETRGGQLITRFQQEARTAAKLDHPNIIPIHRVENEAGLVYLVMKYVSGQSLEELLANGPLPISQVRHVLREAALALSHAHRRHVVHRDVKPANIMLDDDGRVVLTDFGISKALEGTTHITGTGTIIGTPAYMAPEQAKGREVDGRADQYSLAIVGHRALTGKLPFTGDSHSILYQQVFEQPPSVLDQRPDTPADLRLALEQALEKNPDERFSKMEEFAAAVGGDRASSRSTATTTIVSAPIKRGDQPKADGYHPSGVFVALATMAAVIAAALLVFPRQDSATERRSAARPVSPRVSVSSPRRSITPTPTKRPTPTRQRSSSKLRVAEYALLGVRSVPRAILYLDGTKVGLTPITNHRLAAGTHRLRIEQKGYRSVSETIVVKGTRPISRRYALRRQAGR
jgi:serine/threonine protein kinase